MGSFHMYVIPGMLYLFELSNSSAPNVAAQAVLYGCAVYLVFLLHNILGN